MERGYMEQYGYAGQYSYMPTDQWGYVYPEMQFPNERGSSFQGGHSRVTNIVNRGCYRGSKGGSKQFKGRANHQHHYNKTARVADERIKGGYQDGPTDPVRMAKQINKSITSANNCYAFIGVLEKKLYNFDEVNTATFWHRLAKHMEVDRWDISLTDPRLVEFIRYTSEMLLRHNFDGQGLANIAWAYAKFDVEVKDETFLYNLEAAIVEKLPNPYLFTGQALANIAWAFAKVGTYDSEFKDGLKEAIRGRLHIYNEFNCQNLANIVWAYAKFETKDHDFINVLVEVINTKILDFKEQELSITAWAFAYFKIKDNKVIDNLAAAISRKLSTQNSFNGQALSNIALAFGRFNVLDQMLYQLTLAIERKLSVSNFFTGQGLANIFCAYGKFKLINDAFVVKLEETIEKKLLIPRFFKNIELLSVAREIARSDHLEEASDFISTIVSEMDKRFKKKSNTEEYKQFLKIKDMLGIDEQDEMEDEGDYEVEDEGDYEVEDEGESTEDENLVNESRVSTEELAQTVQVTDEHNMVDEVMVKTESEDSDKEYKPLVQVKEEQSAMSVDNSKDFLHVYNDIEGYVKDICEIYRKSLFSNSEYTFHREFKELGFILNNVIISGDKKIAIEVGLSSDYMHSDTLNTEVQERHAILKEAGWQILVIPYRAWRLSSYEEKFLDLHVGIRKALGL